MKVVHTVFFALCCVVDCGRDASTLPEARKKVSLLHQAENEVLDEHLRPQPIWEHGAPLNPLPKGHMLTHTELKHIKDIRCLEAKQVDPAVKCSETAIAMDGAESIPLNAGNYPSWQEPRCQNNGERFCDPTAIFTKTERTQLATQMKKLRTGQHVTCGPRLQHDPVDKWHYEPFYLGVVIAKDWPMHESDAQSLQSFGRILQGRWNMTSSWNGSPSFYARCPNEAMLIILPDKRQAHLSAPSCMFLCEDKGGSEVVKATLSALDSQGLRAGVSAGMEEVYKVLAKTSPMRKSGEHAAEGSAGAESSTRATWEQPIWDWTQRIVFVGALSLLAGSLFVALLVCFLAPGLAKELNKSVV